MEVDDGTEIPNASQAAKGTLDKEIECVLPSKDHSNQMGRSPR